SALFKGGTEAHELILNQIKIKNRETRYVFLNDCSEILADIAQILMGQIQFKDSDFMKFIFNSHNSSYLPLFQSLGFYWTGNNPEQENVKLLTSLFDKAQKNGFKWYAWEAASLLAKFGQKEPLNKLKKSGEERTWTSITDLFKPVPEWELALTSLQNLNPKKQTSSKAQDKTQRMIWRLIPFAESYELEPKEQVITKSGKWSKGRPVALKRLFESAGDLDFLTEHDFKISRAVKVDTYSAFYRRYSRTDYSLSGDSALIAAAGHPLIFREDDPHNPVELILESPVLHVLTEKDSIRIQMEPEPINSYSVLPVEEGRHRIKLVTFSEEHKQIAEILGSQGLKVPETAKKRVMESIAEIAPLLTIHSDIAGQSQTKAQKVKADPRPLLRLYPMDQGLGIDLLVRPVTEGSLIVRPGE
ncbi:MAG: hypothetical protein ABR533_00120, partial [Desulfonatronovibrio sp.]